MLEDSNNINICFISGELVCDKGENEWGGGESAKCGVCYIVSNSQKVYSAERPENGF